MKNLCFLSLDGRISLIDLETLKIELVKPGVFLTRKHETEGHSVLRLDVVWEEIREREVSDLHDPLMEIDV